jgi:hypothetical protein
VNGVRPVEGQRPEAQRPLQHSLEDELLAVLPGELHTGPLAEQASLAGRLREDYVAYSHATHQVWYTRNLMWSRWGPEG